METIFGMLFAIGIALLVGYIVYAALKGLLD